MIICVYILSIVTYMYKCYTQVVFHHWSKLSISNCISLFIESLRIFRFPPWMLQKTPVSSSSNQILLHRELEVYIRRPIIRDNMG